MRRRRRLEGLELQIQGARCGGAQPSSRVVVPSGEGGGVKAGIGRVCARCGDTTTVLVKLTDELDAREKFGCPVVPVGQ